MFLAEDHFLLCPQPLIRPDSGSAPPCRDSNPGTPSPPGTMASGVRIPQPCASCGGLSRPLAPHLASWGAPLANGGGPGSRPGPALFKPASPAASDHESTRKRRPVSRSRPEQEASRTIISSCHERIPSHHIYGPKCVTKSVYPCDRAEYRGSIHQLRFEEYPK